MKKTRFVRIVCLVLALIMTASIVFPLLFQTFAETPKEKLDRLTKELAEIQQNITATEDKIEKKQVLKGYYQQQTNILLSQIETLNLQIEQTRADLALKQEELANKVQQVANTKETFEQRMVAMYVNKNDSNLAILLGAKSYSSAMRYSVNLQQVALSDTEMLELLRQQQAELDEQRIAVEADLTALQESEAQLEQARSSYAQSLQATNAEITANEADLEATEAAYAKKREEEQAARQELDAWISAGNEVDFEYGGGQFFWPVPQMTRISSDYGWRNLWGKQNFHQGVDMAAPAGTPIYAAESGKVSTTAHWSYGTCVKISHGSGLVTVYGHMLKRAVGEGDIVTKGQLIGYVGSTGNSSGNHLHFEVNLNGKYTSPWPYLQG